MAIKNTCVMLMALGIDARSVYEDDFEKPFIEEFAEYYKVGTFFILSVVIKSSNSTVLS